MCRKVIPCSLAHGLMIELAAEIWTPVGGLSKAAVIFMSSNALATPETDHYQSQGLSL